MWERICSYIDKQAGIFRIVAVFQERPFHVIGLQISLLQIHFLCFADDKGNGGNCRFSYGKGASGS